MFAHVIAISACVLSILFVSEHEGIVKPLVSKIQRIGGGCDHTRDSRDALGGIRSEKAVDLRRRTRPMEITSEGRRTPG